MTVSRSCGSLNTVFNRAAGTSLLAVAVWSGSSLLPVTAEGAAGDEGAPADQSVEDAVSIAAINDNAAEVIAASPTTIQNCIPFGANTSFGFTGFIYRDLPAFELSPGQTISFDLGSQNDRAVRRNIFFSVANIDPEPAVVDAGNVVSQGVKALSWTQVVSDTQVPLNPRGNFVRSDFELVYLSEASFSFPGGGLIVGFGAAPPGMFADDTCDQVLVATTSEDSSGNFYSRFFFEDHLTLDVLDDITGDGLSAVALGGMVIGPSPVDRFACDGFDPPFDVSLALKNKVSRAIPSRARLVDEDGLPVTDLDISAPPVVEVSFTPGGGGVAQDRPDQLEFIGRADSDNIFRFD
jgi:hypothetical protein